MFAVFVLREIGDALAHFALELLCAFQAKLLINVSDGTDAVFDNVAVLHVDEQRLC